MKVDVDHYLNHSHLNEKKMVIEFSMWLKDE